MPKLKLLTLISSLSFGGLVGMAAAALLYKGHPQFFQSFGFIEPKWFIAYGGAVGGAVHSGIAYVCVRLFSPALKFISEYEKLWEAYLWYKLGLIDSAKVKELVDHTIDKRFGIKPKHDPSREKAEVSAINRLADRILLKIGAGDKEDSPDDN